MKRVYHRAITLFRELHPEADDLILVANVRHANEKNLLNRRKLKIFNHRAVDEP
ncbi:DUF3885 domain-containing protein [Kroppenstedtia sanguinis]|uniref:DUF3885 domain-containing protein n=1 Tax=Kroppenstedtia sanguinis TaxID=1380684 RepID=A0ABW4CCM5_9BACL